MSDIIFPPEMMLLMLRYFHPETLISAVRVCKTWNELITNNREKMRRKEATKIVFSNGSRGDVATVHYLDQEDRTQYRTYKHWDATWIYKTDAIEFSSDVFETFLLDQPSWWLETITSLVCLETELLQHLPDLVSRLPLLNSLVLKSDKRESRINPPYQLVEVVKAMNKPQILDDLRLLPIPTNLVGLHPQDEILATLLKTSQTHPIRSLKLNNSFFTLKQFLLFWKDAKFSSSRPEMPVMTKFAGIIGSHQRFLHWYERNCTNFNNIDFCKQYEFELNGQLIFTSIGFFTTP